MQIERLERFTESRATPCIFSKGLEDWGALSKWSPQFFGEKFGDLSVAIHDNLPDRVSPYLYQAAGHAKAMCLKSFIEFMAVNERCYMCQREMADFIGLESDYNFLTLVPESEHEKAIHANLWIGKNTRSGLHYDYSNNFLVQIYGVKKVYLAAPQEAKHLYPLEENFTKTQVAPDHPEYKRFPKLKKARFLTGEIGPGEVLFIPKGWFHHICAPEESISLNCWYGDELRGKDFLRSFYRSGWRVWVRFGRDFLWHGMLRRPTNERLFCSPSLGKLVYEKMMQAILS